MDRYFSWHPESGSSHHSYAPPFTTAFEAIQKVGEVGIFENHGALRTLLEEEGRSRVSDTDTEVLVE